MQRRPVDTLMSTLKETLHHPLRTARKVVGRIRRSTVRLPRTHVIRRVNKTINFDHARLDFLNEDDMRAMFTGSYDITLCDFLRKTLAEGDVVLDVGANIGYISAFMASCVEKTGEVHGFEPLPPCFERLQVLASLNPEFPFFFNQTALGETTGWLPISYDPNGNARNATLIPSPSSTRLVQVPVKRLDEYIEENIKDPGRIRLIKIDVEGFEFPVLRGLERFLTNTALRPLIVCEIKPWEIQKIGYTLTEFDQYLKKYGYDIFDLSRDRVPIHLPEMSDMSVFLFRPR